jgi:hypothetical protein
MEVPPKNPHPKLSALKWLVRIRIRDLGGRRVGGSITLNDTIKFKQETDLK